MNWQFLPLVTPFAACERARWMSMTRKETIMKMNRLTTWIGCALLLGVIVGYACNTLAASPAQAKEIA